MKVGIKKVIKRNKFLALHNNTYVVFLREIVQLRINPIYF